jgi:hypothetical protein
MTSAATVVSAIVLVSVVLFFVMAKMLAEPLRGRGLRVPSLRCERREPPLE